MTLNEKDKSKIRWFFVGSILALFFVLTSLFFLAEGGLEDASSDEVFTQQKEPEVFVQEDDQQIESNVNIAELKRAIEQWDGSISGEKSITIADKNGQVLFEQNSEQKYFAASLYKPFVAYFDYQRVDRGEVNLNDKTATGKTRKQCLDEMIRTSDSPCAEFIRAEIGANLLDEKVKALGIFNTSIADLSTNSADMTKILIKIYSGEGLSKESKKSLLYSMKNQIFADALKAGFTNSTMYDKVGFRDLDEYHDVGIVEFSNGEVLIVSVLTKKVGTKNIARLAAAIEQVVL